MYCTMSCETEDIVQNSEEDTVRVAFEVLRRSDTVMKTVDSFADLCSLLKLEPVPSISLFSGLKRGLHFHNRANKFFSGLCERATALEYATVNANGELELNDRANCCKRKLLIVGGGPCGLRMAIEAQLLGCRVVLIERRCHFSRNNIIKIADYGFKDLKSLGISTFYSAFCTGGIHAIAVRQLQLTLLKIALILGVDFHYNVSLERVVEPSTSDEGWRAHLDPVDHPVASYEFDVLIDASGSSRHQHFNFDNPMGNGKQLKAVKKKQTFTKVKYFALSANFVNFDTVEEKSCQEISGISRQCGKDIFNNYLDRNGMSYDIENLVYYRRETHYFLMTIPIEHLLQRNILKENPPSNGQAITHASNVNQEELEKMTLDIANIATDWKIQKFEFSLTESHEKDVAVFDYEPHISSSGSCRVIDRHGKRFFMALVGDSLIAPYWPEGLGIEKGFLAVMDVCYVLQQWSHKRIGPRMMIRLKESLYNRLIQINSNDQAQSSGQHSSIIPEKRYKDYQYRDRNIESKGFYVSDGISVARDSVKSGGREEPQVPPAKQMDDLAAECSEHLVATCIADDENNGYNSEDEQHDGFDLNDIERLGTSGSSIHETETKVEKKSFKKWFQASRHMRKCDSLPSVVVNSKTGDICPCCMKAIRKFDHFLREKLHAVHVECFKCAKCNFCLSGMKYKFDEADQKYYCYKHNPKTVLRGYHLPIVANGRDRSKEVPKSLCPKLLNVFNENSAELKSSEMSCKGFHVASVIKKLGSLFQTESKSSEKPVLKCVSCPQLSQSGQLDICHFCWQRVYAAERMTICKKPFHRYCFKCQTCGIRLNLKTFVFDKKTGCFLCIPDSRKEGVKVKSAGSSSKKKITEMAKRISTIFRSKADDFNEVHESDDVPYASSPL